MRTTRPILAALSAFGFAAVTLAPASAQTGSKTPPSASNSAQTNPSESLSSKLNKSDGVITPNSSVDPGIKVPAPDPHPNSTPVIPPSSSGGVAK